MYYSKSNEDYVLTIHINAEEKDMLEAIMQARGRREGKISKVIRSGIREQYQKLQQENSSEK